MSAFLKKLKNSHAVLMFAWLAFLELAVFGRTFRNTGFYLDDWTMLGYLHFAPQDILAKIAYYFFVDGRVAMRPVEALQFPLMQACFGVEPFGYHFTYAFFEVLAIFFFYLLLVRLFESRGLAFIAASLALLDPRHDTTHYWVMCNSVSLSLFFSTFSLWLADLSTSVKRHRRLLVFLSWLSFTAGIFNYELFLPFAAFNALILAKSAPNKGARFKSFFLAGFFFALPVLAFVVYQKIFIPMFVQPLVHVPVFDIAEIASTLVDGLNIQLGPKLFSEIGQRIWLEGYLSSLTTLLPMMALGLLFAALSLLVLRDETQAESFVQAKKTYLRAILVGLIAILCSYSIFGLNKEYHPLIESIFNRVNTGGGLGGSLVLSGLVCYLTVILREVFLKRGNSLLAKLSTVLPAGFLFILMSFYCLADLVTAKQWQVSWLLQRTVIETLLQNKASFSKQSSIFLVGCPRYVNWAPIYDGVWDFGMMCQMMLNSRDVKGGVVCDRLTLSKEKIEDISKGFTVETYRFPDVFILHTYRHEVKKVPDVASFLQYLEDGGLLGKFLDKDLLEAWKKQVSH
jgi:hypothetical protein